MYKKMTKVAVCAWIIVGLTLFSAFYAMKNLLMGKEVYHDTLLSENFDITPDWKEIDIRGIAKIERDRQMVGIRLQDPYEIDFEAGVLRNGTGQVIEPEVRLVTDKGKIYRMYFGNARGKHLANYRPEVLLSDDEIPDKLQIRCNTPFQVSRVLWTTYNIKDLK